MRNQEPTSLIRHLEVLRAVTEAVSRSLDLNEVVQRSLAALTHVTGHEIASLHLISADGNNMLLCGDRGLSDELRRVNLELPLGEGLIGRVALSGTARRVDDASMAEDLLPAARAAVSIDGIRGFVCVPIRARHRILGTLSLGRQTEDRFTDEEVALLECVADQIGLALDNARLYGEINRQLDDLRRAQIEVVKAERLSAVNGLAAGVAHEINNPLTIIMAQLHLMGQAPMSSEMEEALGVDDPECLFHLGAHGRLPHQVKLRHDDGQRIVDLVRHSRGEAVDGGQPLRLHHLDLRAAQVVELPVDLAVEPGIVQGEADLIRHALEQRDFLVGEAVFRLPAEGQRAEDAMAGPDGYAHEPPDAVDGDRQPCRGEQIVGHPDVVDPARLTGQRQTSDQSLAHGELDIDPSQLVAEPSVSPEEQAIAVGGYEMKTRDLVSGDVGQSGERALQHLVEVERAAHGLIHRAQNLQVPDQGRRLIVSHDLVKGSKSSAIGLGGIRWAFRETVRPRLDTVSFGITREPSPAPLGDPPMDGNRARAPSEDGVYAQRDSDPPTAPSRR